MERIIPVQTTIFAVAVLLLFLGWVAYLVRYHRLSLRDSLLWILSTAAALLFFVVPGTLVGLARVLGIAVPANALFALTFVYVLLNLLSATVAISGNAARTRRLAQECAVLRAELDALRARIDGQAPPPR
jgi:hypothetical protein